MVQQITKGVKISVKTVCNGVVYRGHQQYYSFNYFVTIENKSKDTVQLTERFWNIYDALNKPDFVQGDGVVGQTPVLEPNDEYSYKSSCLLLSTIGSMNGHYKMVNINTAEEFLVVIPTFQLTTVPTLN